MVSSTLCNQKSNRGFSLFEVILGLFLFSVGMASAISMIHGSAKAQRRQAQRVHARAVAEKLAIEQALRGYDEILKQYGTGSPQKAEGEGWVRISFGVVQRATLSEESIALPEFAHAVFIKKIGDGASASEHPAIRLLAVAWPLEERFARDLGVNDESTAKAEKTGESESEATRPTTEDLDNHYSFSTRHSFEQRHSIIITKPEAPQASE